MLKTKRTLAALLAAVLLATTVSAQSTGFEKYVPDDTEAIIQVNIKQVLTSPLLKALLGDLKGPLAAQDGPLKELGFNPLTDLDQVIIAVPGGGNVEKAVVLVKGKFDVAKFEAMAEKEGGKADLKVHKIGTTKVFEAKVPVPNLGEQGMFLSFVDGTTIAMAGTKEGISDTIARKDGTKKGALKKEMKDLIGKLDPKLSLGIAVLGTVAGQAEVSDRINNITGGISLVDDVKADFVIAAKNADTAKELESLISMALDQAKQILPIVAANQKQLTPIVDLIGAIKVSSAGTNVNIKGQLTKEDIEKAIKKAGQ